MGNVVPAGCSGCDCGGAEPGQIDVSADLDAVKSVEPGPPDEKVMPSDIDGLTIPIRKKSGSRRTTENPLKLSKRLATIDWMPDDLSPVEIDFEEADFDEDAVQIVDTTAESPAHRLRRGLSSDEIQKIIGPDFSGDWLCIGAENMEKFLTQIEVGWAMRRAAKALNYGVRKLHTKIVKIDDDTWEASQDRVPGTMKFSFSQVMYNESCGMVVCCPEGATALHLAIDPEPPGAPVDQYRYFQPDGTMVIETTPRGSTGCTSKRIFELHGKT
jgi:hypothetical protein